MLPVAIGAFGCVVMILLLLGMLKSAFVWPAGLLVATLVSIPILKYIHIDRPGSLREQHLFDIAIIVWVVLWTGFNVFYTSQHVFTDRDPGTYTVTAVHLIQEDNVAFRVPQEFKGLNGVTSESPGFAITPDSPDVIHSQGLHLVPALFGLAGRIVGQSRMMHIGPIFGALALFSIFGFARLLIKPRWAFFSTVILGVSLPLIYFSRDIYTEPLALAFTFGALSTLWLAQKTRKLSIWLISGLMAGAGMLTRIDALLPIAAFIFFMTIYLITRKPKERKSTVREASFFALGLIATVSIGWLDLSLLSVPYYMDHRELIMKEVLLIIVILLAGLVSLFVAWKVETFEHLIKKWNYLFRWELLSLLIISATLLLISRPLWMSSHSSKPNVFVEAIQSTGGFPVDAYRDYAETTTDWISWYVGPIVAVLGIMGLCLAVVKVRQRRSNITYLSGILVVLIPSVVYLLQPSVSPDQIWAARRFLPVVFPGIIIFGMYTLAESDKFFQKLRFRKAYIILTLIGLLLPPLLVSQPFLGKREMARLIAVERVCESIPKNAAVLWTAQGRYEMVQPTMEFCKVPSAGYINIKMPRPALAATAKQVNSKDRVLIVAVYGEHADQGVADYNRNDFTEIVNYSYNVIEQTIFTPPKRTIVKNNSIYLGIAQPDGSISPINKTN